MRREEPLARERRVLGPGVEVRHLGPRSRFSLRAPHCDLSVLEAAWRAPLPTSLGSTSHKGGNAALCLGPDEWLLIAPPAAGERIASDLTAIAEAAFSVVDVSHRSVALLVQGEGGAKLLAAGCPLDLRRDSFPTGRAARSLLAGVEVTLWRTSGHSLYLEFWRSYASYVWQFLASAAADR